MLDYLLDTFIKNNLYLITIYQEVKMTCPKCSEKNSDGSIYCRFCGIQFMIECKWHKKLEPIEISCKTKLDNAIAKKEEFVKKRFPPTKRSDYFPAAVFWTMLLFWGVVLIQKYCEPMGLLMCGLLAIGYSICVVCIMIWHTTKWIDKIIANEENAKQEFFRLHPDLAEIIKKAESTDGKESDKIS